MTHFDAFSGLGGWALAAHEAGFETIGFCECNPRAIDFLKRTWGLPVHNDIKTLDGKLYHGRLTLFTASPPCQPASRAGEQRGAADDRWLWDDSLRFIAEAEPDWFVVENPIGLLDLDFDGILSQMEGLGYEIQTYDIPACAVDSPQERHRLWIVGCHMGNAEGEPGRPDDRHERQGLSDAGGPPKSRVADPGCVQGRQEQPERQPDRRAADGRHCAGNPADASSKGCASRQHVKSREHSGASKGARGLREWSRYVWVPCENGKIRRAPDDTFGMDHGLPVELFEELAAEHEEAAQSLYDKDGYRLNGVPHSSIIEALGNAICWPVAAEILKGIAQVIHP
jgi:DNA (cytosine-5)-methyltransferase 1